MTLIEKIMILYPELSLNDFSFYCGGTIKIKNDSDGKGDYIAKWNHPTLPKPTDEELA